MGKYYTINGRNLYVYVTGGDMLLDLKLFPADLHLFDSDSAWRMTDRIAVVNGATESALSKAEIILNINMYKRMEQPSEVLEAYFTSGEESIFTEIPIVEEPVVEVQKEFEVIIPEVVNPIVGFNKPIEEPERIEALNEEELLEKVLKRVEDSLGKEKAPRTVEPIVASESVVPVKMFEETIDLFNKMIQKITTTPETVSRVETSVQDLNHRMMDFMEANQKIQETQLETWSTLLENLTKSLQAPKPTPEPTDEYTEILKRIDDLLEEDSEPEKPIIVESETPQTETLEGLIASLIGTPRRKEPLTEHEPLRPVKVVELEAGKAETMKGEIEAVYRYLSYSKYLPEIQQGTQDAVECLSVYWDRLEPVILAISRSPESYDLGRASKIDLLSVDDTQRMIDELESLKGRINGKDERLGSKIDELLSKLNTKLAEIPRKSEYDIPENRLLKGALMEISEGVDEALKSVDSTNRFIRESIRYSTNGEILNLAQSLLDNNTRKETLSGLQAGIKATVDSPELKFLEDVCKGNLDDIKGRRVNEDYAKLVNIVENYGASLQKLYSIQIPKTPVGSEALYEQWCLTKFLEGTYRNGYILGADNNLTVNAANICITSNKSTFYTFNKGEKQVRIYHNSQETAPIILESITGDTKQTRKYRTDYSYAGQTPEKEVNILTVNPSTGDTVITLKPESTNYEFMEHINRLL